MAKISLSNNLLVVTSGKFEGHTGRRSTAHEWFNHYAKEATMKYVDVHFLANGYAIGTPSSRRVPNDMTKENLDQYVDNTRPYSYLCALEDVLPGDFVVVETVHGLSVARVVAVTDTPAVKAKKFVVCKIDLLEYLTKKEQTNRVEELYKAMELRMREANRIHIFREAAKSDPIMAKLFEQLEGLSAEARALSPSPSPSVEGVFDSVSD